MAAKKNVRLKRPVSGSTVERRIAASRARRCSRPMTMATKASRISAVRLTATSATAVGPSDPAAEPASTAIT